MSEPKPVRTLDGLPDIALSVRQPWAFGLAMGWKGIENRSWRQGNPGLHFRGEFCIHASTGMTRDEYEDAADTFAWCGFQCPPAADLQRGGIIGVGRIAGIITESDSRWFFGPKGLVVVDARPIEFIAVGGQLGFFKWKPLLPFANGTPVVPPKWMLPAEPKKQRPEKPRIRKATPAFDDPDLFRPLSETER